MIQRPKNTWNGGSVRLWKCCEGTQIDTPIDHSGHLERISALGSSLIPLKWKIFNLEFFWNGLLWSFEKWWLFTIIMCKTVKWFSPRNLGLNGPRAGMDSRSDVAEPITSPVRSAVLESEGESLSEKEIWSHNPKTKTTKTPTKPKTLIKYN